MDTTLGTGPGELHFTTTWSQICVHKILSAHIRFLAPQSEQKIIQLQCLQPALAQNKPLLKPPWHGAPQGASNRIITSRWLEIQCHKTAHMIVCASERKRAEWFSWFSLLSPFGSARLPTLLYSLARVRWIRFRHQLHVKGHVGWKGTLWMLSFFLLARSHLASW